MEDQIRLQLEKDPVMANIVASTQIPDLELNHDIYQGLVRSIIYQQLSGKAANTIHQRFLALFNDGYPHTDQVLAYDIEKLRSVGLSRQKASYIQNVANFFEAHHPVQLTWDEWDDERLIKHLTQIKGVGKWTVEMILMFWLGRPDVLPVDDLGIQQAMIKAYKIEEKGRQLKVRMKELAAPWRPYRSYGSRLLWRWLDASK
ncbi:MAG: DNA-3-methyladenine glycosylase 2 family protein [Chitinophagales bacterium]|nr:DNA-3-methyladenine glycosylase 2 family protein [Chitinophagales bacterium]